MLPLNDKLAYDWARGGVKSSQLQSYALRAQSQGATGCEDLAAAGSRGCHRANLFRSLSRLITAPAAPTVEWFVMPTKTGPQPHSFFLPHKMFASLYANDNKKWISGLRGGVSASARYWEAVSHTEFMQQHPHKLTQLWGLLMGLRW